MNWLLIAGGAFISTFVAPKEIPMMNHILRGDEILAKQVVCRNRWGTPMLPTPACGYSLIGDSLIAGVRLGDPINPTLVARSMLQPPGGSLSTDFDVKSTKEFGLFDAKGKPRNDSVFLTPFRPVAQAKPEIP